MKSVMRGIEDTEVNTVNIDDVGAFSTTLSATNIFQGGKNILLEAIRDNIHMIQSP